MQPRKSWLPWLALGVWIVAIGCGVVYAWVYESTSAAVAAAADRWPAGSTCTLSPEGATLVMFVHPHCPCSRATLAELAVLMTHCRGRLHAEVMFLQPPSFSDEWTHSDLWESASRIPDVAARIDVGAAEQRRFGARVSGETFVYSAGGELLFHGGITAGRGHVGDNAGRTAIESLVAAPGHGSRVGGVSQVRGTPVFGCQLQSPEGCTAACRAAGGPGP